MALFPCCELNLGLTFGFDHTFKPLPNKVIRVLINCLVIGTKILHKATLSNLLLNFCADTTMVWLRVVKDGGCI